MEPTEVEIIRNVRLDDEFELDFTTYSLGRRRLGSARIFRNSAKYTGPTRSGLDMPREQVDSLIPVLRRLSDELEKGLCAPPCEYASLDAGRSAHWLVQVLVHDSRPDQQYLDVRKFVSGEKYMGPTRKGIRLAVDHIDELADGLEYVSASLHGWREGRSGLFAPVQDEDHVIEGPADPGAGVPDHLKGYF